jgi:hypothetical protein
MDLSPYSEALRADLIRAAEVGDEGVRAAAERLTLALEPALRLALMSALSDAAAEITAALDGPVVEVRLQGRDPAFVVANPAPAAHQSSAEPDDDGDVARITLRLPEAVKARAEAAAAAAGQSLNTWLVAAARAAAHAERIHRHAHRNSPRRITGWVR